ncbi:MAG: hypothetical protein WCX64_02045 [Candidatus Micrarchaeia archaeon]
MDLAKPKTLAALEAIIELEKFSQYEVWKKAGTSFGTAHYLVNFLQEKHVISKTGKKYSILTWPGLLSLFAAYRTFPKPLATYHLAISVEAAKDFLNEKGFTYCLTSAWKYYDDYLRDPTIHVYSPTDGHAQNAVQELSQLAKGTTIINVYPQDVPVKSTKKKEVLLTSFSRTLLDMYSSNYAYGTDNWIKKKAEQWQQA